MSDPMKRAVSEDFGELLQTLVQRYGSQDALGRLIGMSGSRVGRAMAGQYSFNIENCLKLAEATNESPAVVLRAAGKREIAARLERLFGKSRPSLDPRKRAHLDDWNNLSPVWRERLRVIVQDLAKDERRRKKQRRSVE
jgi:DNA-binding transcriptional regulator YdaS (Cro superfamily)